MISVIIITFVSFQVVAWQIIQSAKFEENLCVFRLILYHKYVKIKLTANLGKECLERGIDMKTVTGRSTKRDVGKAIEEAVSKISDVPVLIIFSADQENFSEYSILLSSRFPQSIVVGSTSYIHMCEQGYSKEGICLTAISDIKCCGGVIEEAGRFPGKYIDRFKADVSKISDRENGVCFELCALTYYCEELFLDRLHHILKERNIPLFGGSAGSVKSKGSAVISYNGKVYTEAVAYIFLYGQFRLHFYKENIFKPMKHQYVVTDAEVSERIVYEYNNVPAARIIAKALGTDIVSLQSVLAEHPMGRMVDNDIYITDHIGVVQDEGLKYYATVYNNTRVVMLEADDYKKVFQETMKNIYDKTGIPDFAVVINCVSRSIRFENDSYLPEYYSGLKNGFGSFICFSGYGEQLNNHHLNQTMVIATFSN